MPNRIIKDSISRSDSVSSLTDFQFRLWVHLITYVDDFGRGDARPAIIRGNCFPLRDRVTNKDIEKGLADLAGAGCVGLYTVDGKPYLYFPNWEEHQRVRQKVSKCPPPESGIMISSAAICGNSPQGAARIQSNPESNPESESNPNCSADADRAADFERFWNAYPRKAGKKKAKDAFMKINVPLDSLLSSLEEQKKTPQWTKDGGQFIPYPATWLNQDRWEDEIGATSASPERQLDEDEIRAVRRMMEQDNL